MRFVRGLARATLLVCLTAAAGGCRGRNDGAGRDATLPTDTGAMGGLTPDQIRARAEPMTPARAESLGIVDTTIHVEEMDSSAIITRSTAPLSSAPDTDTTITAPKQ
jgi:hypothetical protein